MGNARILIVEDEALVATDLERKLTKYGYSIVGIACQGKEAVEMALGFRPQLILMDIQLEGTMDGIDAAEAIQNQYNVPVIYLTAYSDRATLSRAKLTGPLGYILKPFDDREILTQIELSLFKHETEKQLHAQREWLEITLASIGDAVIATNSEGAVTLMNPMAETLIGLTSGEAVGKDIEDILSIVDERTRDPLRNLKINLLGTGLIANPSCRWTVLDAEGKKTPVKITGAPIRDHRGDEKGLVLVFRDISLQRQAEKEKDSLIAELEAALADVKKLSGLLPICSSCKKIRDDNGYWNQIEAYIKENSEADFSHGICPECTKLLYPDTQW